MTDSGTVDVHIDPYDYTNDIRVNLWLSCDVPFASRYFTKPEVRCIGILLSHTPCSLYRCSSLPVLFFFLVDSVPASPWHSHLCLARRWWMPSHREGPKNISPSSEEQIPLSSYPVPCQTFRWTCKLSLWSPCYRWRLSNPKVHRTVGSDYDTLMVWGTKTHANTPCYNNWFQTILSQSITNKFGSIQYDRSSNVILSMLF